MDCEVFTLFKNKQRQCGQQFLLTVPSYAIFFITENLSGLPYLRKLSLAKNKISINKVGNCLQKILYS
jgi:hypothetical protein